MSRTILQFLAGLPVFRLKPLQRSESGFRDILPFRF